MLFNDSVILYFHTIKAKMYSLLSPHGWRSSGPCGRVPSPASSSASWLAHSQWEWRRLLMTYLLGKVMAPSVLQVCILARKDNVNRFSLYVYIYDNSACDAQTRIYVFIWITASSLTGQPRLVNADVEVVTTFELGVPRACHATHFVRGFHLEW